jgi:hypothetical protein
MIMAINNNIVFMKRILINTGIIPGLLAILFLNSCKETIDPVVDQLNFNRAFTPIGITAQISKITTVTITWTAEKDADHYVIEIYQGSDFIPASLVKKTDVAGGLTTYTYVLPAGDTQFTARIKTVSSISGVEDSKWVSVGFKTAPENLFTGYISIMTGIGSCTVKWLPGSTATALAFYKGTNQTSYPLTAAEITAGEKALTSVPNGKYEIRLMNTTFLRGKTNIVLEGDAILAPGGDLITAIKALPAGGVLLLTNGASFGMTKPDTVKTSIKIRGVFSTDLPKIYLITGGGNHMFDIDPSLTLSDSLVFENVNISCLYDDAGTLRHRGVIDQELTAMHIGKIRFINSTIRNSDRSLIRLRGHANGQVITNLEFNGCIMYDFAVGGTQTYGIVNPNAATATIANIKFINSTIYSFRNNLINYGAGVGCQSVIVDNCTFDQMMLDVATARYFIDFGASGTSTGTIAITDCLFGKTSTIANGIRNSLMTISGITGSYYTTDFVPVTGTFISNMIAYSGLSTTLWTNPPAGTFTFLDAGFAGKATAGDPRWRP